MIDQIGFDIAAAHKYFSAECFNRAWDLIDKSERTPAEDEEMIQLSLTSIWHWTQRPDCTPQNLSVGYWQASRIYALLGRVRLARHYGQLSLEAIQKAGDLPFYLGYAYEALARAEWLADDSTKMAEYLALARKAAKRVPDPDAQAALIADLESIGG
jgi:hypothetical protein